MQLALIWEVAKVAYSKLLRGLVKQAVDNPDSDVDEIAMKILDAVFDYKE